MPRIFEPKEYTIQDMRIYIMDKSLTVNDLVGFEIQQSSNHEKQKLYYSAHTDSFYAL